jgi:hypothetical protein
MNTWLIIVIVFIITILINLKNTNEHFTQNEQEYKQQIITEPLKQDLYMNFLGDLNNSFKKNLNDESNGKNLAIKQQIMCDDKVKIKVQTKALNEAFEKISIDKSKIFKSPVFDNSPSQLDFIDNSKNNCLYKANHISEFTNPMFYLSETITFPPRWLMKTYKDVPLPKHTSLKQWNNMYNCCKGNF